MSARLLLPLAVLVLAAPGLHAIPEVVGQIGGVGGGVNVEEDADDPFLDESRWERGDLPGEWEPVPGFAADEKRRRTTNPRLFGLHPLLVEASATKGRLEAISVAYLDRGSFFDRAFAEARKRGENVSNPPSNRWMQQTSKAFDRRFEEIEEQLRDALKERSGKSSARAKVGRTPLLQTEFEDYRVGPFRVRLAAEDKAAIALVIMREEEVAEDYRARGVSEIRGRDREKVVSGRVEREANGDVKLEGVPVYLQGSRPDCGICTLGMVTHYFGLRFGVQGMAAGARVRASGLRRGDGILQIYKAFAEEAEVDYASAPSFDFEKAQRSIEAGCPVIVFRRYSPARNDLHNRFAATFRDDPEALLPAADGNDRATWPGKEAPAHASVVTGFNKERGEVIFMESWGEHVRDRRMRLEELEGTSYKAFYFKL